MKRLPQAVGALLVVWLCLHSLAIAQDRQRPTLQPKDDTDLQLRIRLLEQRVNQLQQQVTVLLQVIRVSGADVEITAGNNLTIKAGREMKVSPAWSLDIRTDNFKLYSATSDMQSTGTSSIKASATLSMRAAMMSINASPLFLNAGTKPIATVGAGQTISGSANIFGE